MSPKCRYLGYRSRIALRCVSSRQPMPRASCRATMMGSVSCKDSEGSRRIETPRRIVLLCLSKVGSTSCPPEKLYPALVRRSDPSWADSWKQAIDDSRPTRDHLHSDSDLKEGDNHPERERIAWAETEPGVIVSLRRHSLIPMMQSAKDRSGDQLGRAGNVGISLLLRNRPLAVQTLVRPNNMVILLDELAQ